MKKILLLLCAALSLVIHSSCSEDNPSESSVYIPQVENQWRAENNAQHTFSLSSDDEGLNRGVFTGNEDYPDSNFFGSFIVGFFINREIEFNVQRPSGTFKFKGTMVNENRMELNSPAGALVLVK